MVWPSGAKRADRMLPLRNVSWRYTGGGVAEAENRNFPATSPAATASHNAPANTDIGNDFLRGGGATGVAPEVGPPGSATSAVRDDSMERFIRFRSALNSAAVWHRMSRSFSSVLVMISSSLGGRLGLIRTGAAGARFRMASVTTAEVSPLKGGTPVAIS